MTEPRQAFAEAHLANEFERELLETLTLRVRAITIDQIARVWFAELPNASKLARRRVLRLERKGLVQQLDLLAHPALELASPLSSWQPDLPAPDFQAVAYRTSTRWTEIVIATSFVIATPLAANLLNPPAPTAKPFGGRVPRLSEATHDLHLTAVYLRMRTELPTRAESWQSEAAIADRRRGREGKVPDALVRDGKSLTAIEFAGAYPAAKLQAFHDYCDSTRWGYELW